MSEGLIKLIKVSVVIFLVGFAIIAFTTTSAVGNENKGRGQEVCEALDSGKIDTTGNPATVTVNAPEGRLINQYCVKAGSDVSVPDGAVVYVPVNPPVASITFPHPSGKSISHYSVGYVVIPSPTPTETTASPTPTETPSETPTESPTPTDTPTTALPTETPSAVPTGDSTASPKAAKPSTTYVEDGKVVALAPLPTTEAKDCDCAVSELPKTGPEDVTPWILILGAMLALAGMALKVISSRA